MLQYDINMVERDKHNKKYHVRERGINNKNIYMKDWPHAFRECRLKKRDWFIFAFIFSRVHRYWGCWNRFLEMRRLWKVWRYVNEAIPDIIHPFGIHLAAFNDLMCTSTTLQLFIHMFLSITNCILYDAALHQQTRLFECRDRRFVASFEGSKYNF